MAFCLPGQAFAAEPAQAGASEPSNDIIVTAQRRNEALEDVPMSVSVLPQSQLTNLGVNSVRDLQNVTTGFQLNNSGSYPQPAIRGITTINAGAYENNVALFVDGLYQYTAQVLNMDLPNVQNIQVLKGPQGTLYGRNATGGAILIDTIDPGKRWAGNLEGTYGRFDDFRARGYVAGPLSDRVGLSIAGTLRQTDGYYKIASRTTPGTFDGRGLGLKQASLRTKLKFDISDSFRATLAYNYLRASDPRGVFFTAVENVSSPYTGANATRPTGLGEVAGDAFTLDFKQHEGSLKLELDTGIGTLRSITGYTHGKLRTTYDADGSYAATSYSDSIIHDKTWQESIDYTIKALDNLDLIVGANYYNIKTAYDPNYANVAYAAPAGSTPGTPLSSYRKLQEIFFWRTKEAWAGFIDATYHVAPRLSVNLGGRYSSETQDVAAEKNTYCTATAGCTVNGVLIPLGGITGTPYTRASSAQGATYRKFTPRASIRYELAPRTNVYFSWSQGFRAGEWNSVPPIDGNMAAWKTLGQIGQESINAFELGIKTAQRRFRADLSAFLYNYKDLQVSYTVFVPPTNLAVVSLQSVPKARVYGVEGSVDWEAVDDLHLRAGATWLHARYGDRAVFVGSSVNVNGVGYNVNSDPLKVFPNVSAVAMDLTGKQMARAPDFTAFVGFDYLFRKGAGGLRIAANAKYTSSYVVTNPSLWGGEPLAAYNARKALDPNALPNNSVMLAGTPYAARSNEERARQGAYVLVNASVTWTDPTDHYYLRVWGNNLTDRIYRTHYNPSSSTYSPVGEPRTYGVTAGYKF
ncbi:MAG: TonB-dependent receptor [Sphingomonadales bacterium]|nr:TonB-dependent receptor [Sphingomonadales bacterium]